MTLESLERAQYVKVLSMLGNIQKLLRSQPIKSPAQMTIYGLVTQIIQILKETEEGDDE